MNPVLKQVLDEAGVVLGDEIERLTKELSEAEKVCDSYATENQQFHDRFTAAEAALSEARAKQSALDDLLAHYPATITEWADGVRAASWSSPAKEPQ